MNAVDPRYPIGKFEPKESYEASEVQACLARIKSFPERLEAAVKGLSPSQLDTPYREEGWTVRQVIHHVADSHMNAYIRTKWTLTEETPMIKVYDEKGWAQTPETKAAPALSLELLKMLHSKWMVLLSSLTWDDLHKAFIHPDTRKHVPLERMIATYAWHGDHHLAHITSLKARMGWK